MRWLIAIVLPLTGCFLSQDNDRVAPLSEFNPLTSIRDTATITFEHFGDNLDSPDCLILPSDITAKIAGVPLEVVRRGGYVENGGGCEFPKMELLELPEVATATLVIEDASQRMSCDLGDALVRLTLAMPGSVAAGQTATVRVTDLPGDTDVLTAYLATPTHRQEVGRAMSGDQVTIAVPAHYRGDYELRVVASHRTNGPIDYNTPCGILFTSHQARHPIVVTGS